MSNFLMTASNGPEKVQAKNIWAYRIVSDSYLCFSVVVSKASVKYTPVDL